MPTSKFDAVVQAKCPKCRRGKLFLGPVYSFKGQKMYDHCPNCGMKYEVEPGYFYAAMYVSYALIVAEIVTTAVLTYYISGGSENPMLYIATIFTVIFLLAPFNYRYSRVILLHCLSPKVKYNPEYDNK